MPTNILICVIFANLGAVSISHIASYRDISQSFDGVKSGSLWHCEALWYDALSDTKTGPSTNGPFY